MTHVLPHSLRLPQTKSVRRRGHRGFSPAPTPARAGSGEVTTCLLRLTHLTCSVRFAQADLGDAARVTVRSPPLQNAILL